jgi:hypothetical protein
MAEPGRPRKLDEGKLREIAALVSAGYSLAGTAEYVGCSIHTIRRELKRNKEFAEKVRKNQLYAELDPLNTIRHLGKTNWRAAAWYLERTRPDRYQRQNPALLRPSDLQDFLQQLFEIVGKEVTDEEVLGRIGQRLQAKCDPITRSIMEFYLDGRPARPVRVK